MVEKLTKGMVEKIVQSSIAEIITQKRKPIPPWKRIIKEHLIDATIGAFVGIWLAHVFHFGLIKVVQQLGGLTVIGSFIVVIKRIYKK